MLEPVFYDQNMHNVVEFEGGSGAALEQRFLRSSASDTHPTLYM